MLRITTGDNSRVRTLRLEGRLEGPWVALLERCWRKTRAAAAERKKVFRVDMSGVSFIDAAGQSVIAAMHRHGVEFTADDALTKAMIDEITTGGPDSRRAARPAST
jgi:ABC-type transporter Mla MlaB component